MVKWCYIIYALSYLDHVVMWFVNIIVYFLDSPRMDIHKISKPTVLKNGIKSIFKRKRGSIHVVSGSPSDIQTLMSFFHTYEVYHIECCSVILGIGTINSVHVQCVLTHIAHNRVTGTKFVVGCTLHILNTVELVLMNYSKVQNIQMYALWSHKLNTQSCPCEYSTKEVSVKK